jgi:hypothetical protein
MTTISSSRTRGRWLAPAVLGAVSALLFHPMFAGHLLVGGTDSLYAHYPNLLFGHRTFWQYGAFSLWNPYIFAGFDFTKSIHAHYLNPTLAPLLLVPEKYMFQVLTVAFFAINWLIAFFWYRIALLYCEDQWQAILVGIVAQAGMFFCFLTTTFIGVPMYLYATLAVYIVLTFERRRTFRNYVYLSILLALLFIYVHPIYVVGFTAPIAAAFIAKCYPRYFAKPQRVIGSTILAAGLTGLTVALYRIVPVFEFLAQQGNVGSDLRLPAFYRRGYFLLTEFIPQVFGIDLSESFGISGLLEGGQSQYHTQAHNGLYFGILPLTVAYVAARKSEDPGVPGLAFLFLALSLFPAYLLGPLSDVLGTVLSPLNHEAFPRITTNFAFLFLLILALRAFSSLDMAAIRTALREVAVIAVLILLAAAALWAVILHAGWVGSFGLVSLVFRLAMIASLLGLFLAWRRGSLEMTRQFGSWAAIGASVLLVALSLAIAFRIGVLPGDYVTSHTAATIVGALPLVLAAIWLAGRGDKPISATGFAVLIAGAVILAIAIVMPMPADPAGPILRDLLATGMSALLGTSMFLVLATMSVRLLGMVASGQRSFVALAPILVIVTAADLVAAYEVYAFVGDPVPFVAEIGSIYPPNEIERWVVDRSLPNLIVNATFEMNGSDIVGWGFGGAAVGLCDNDGIERLPHRNAIHACALEPDGNLFQDIALHTATKDAAFGVWARAPRGMHAGIFMTSPSNNLGGAIIDVPADGKWHWLTVLLHAKTPLIDIRPHMSLLSPGELDVFAPKVVTGSVVEPDDAPEGARQDYVSANPARSIDLIDYRVSHPSIFASAGASADGMTNLPSAERIPSYSGVDSDWSAEYEQFLAAFVPLNASWYNRGGLSPLLTDPRLLDLLGVRYDLGASNGVVERPNALARFSAFASYQVADDLASTLTLLKSPAFDPTRQVVLEREPAQPGPERTSSQFTPLRYQQTGRDTLVLTVTADNPRIILFNDRYSPSWEASWNGARIPIIRANAIFMAAVVPAGPGELTFAFNPRLFYRLVILAIVVGALLFGALISDFIRGSAEQFRNTHYLRGPPRV